MISVLTVVYFIHWYLEVQGYGNTSHACGLDRSPVTKVYEGLAAIETYPWMGMLYYQTGNNLRFTTAVVLVTRQMAIATASEIDKLPKAHIRAKARVVLGTKCGKDEIKVRSYTYHSEYDKHSTSALAMIQLETDHLKIEPRPICQPPAHFREPQFFAFTLADSCKNPKVRIHKMEYVNNDNCTDFYRRNGLGQISIWPVHAACARAVSGGRCVWRSGSVLAVKQDGRWRLLGFSVYGPGCGAPSRFLHYGIYHEWVKRSSSAVGQPAITRLGDDHIVMRRSLAKVQRYGPCDLDETFTELYSDKVAILYKPGVFSAKYNITLHADVEYSCIVFKVRSLGWEDYKNLGVSPQPLDVVIGGAHSKKPRISLRRWCATSNGMCNDFQYLEIRFYVDITFSQSVEFNVHVYGREAKIISPPLAMQYANIRSGRRPALPDYMNTTLYVMGTQKFIKFYKWFFQRPPDYD